MQIKFLTVKGIPFLRLHFKKQHKEREKTCMYEGFHHSIIYSGKILNSTQVFRNRDAV